uniref:Nuclear pore glycoprotein p62 n=1 Tax=Cyanoderma ruficeps TaxID=181631 RepID=A0A8C3NWV1_9PASS
MSQFSFGAAAPGGAFSLGAPRAAATTAATAGFSFSAPAATSSGFSFGSAAPAASGTQPAGLFSFSKPAAAAQPSGFSFGSAGAAPAAPAAAAFPLGANTPKVNFGASTATAAPGITGGFSFGAPAATSTPSSQAAAPSGFAFGSAGTSSTSTAPSGTTGGFTFSSGSTTQAGAAGFSIGTAAPQATSAGLTFGTAPAAAATTMLGSTGPSLFASVATSSAPASSSSTGLSRESLKAGLSLGQQRSSRAAVGGGSRLGTAFPRGSAVDGSCNLAPPVMTYAQLESLINKWSLELEDQEKHFLHQATQVNAWDRMLIENGEKITSLHREVEKVKVDQKRLDQELDFILSQQKELEDLLTPLEESVKEQSGTIYLQHADEERERTYKLAENIDAQLKRMAQDLKDITEHLNTSRGPADTSDPLQQICKILNAHMDSLQWIDQNSAVLQRKVEEVTKVCESRRKEQERSFRITFD